MFVSALDKPWTDTPFLLQGFLIRSDAEIAALTRSCQFVFVDPERCVGAARDRFRRPLMLALSAKKNLWQKFLDLLPNGTSEKQQARATEPDECEVLDALAVFRDTGKGIAPTRALVRARETFDRSRDALAAILGDIQMNRTPDIKYAEDAVGQIIDSATTSPEALLWLAQLKQRDDCAYHHAIRVSIYMVAMGNHVGLPKEQLHILGLAGLLQDVGKIKLPQALTDKTTDLSPEERTLVEKHVTHSLAILRVTRDTRPRSWRSLPSTTSGTTGADTCAASWPTRSARSRASPGSPTLSPRSPRRSPTAHRYRPTRRCSVYTVGRERPFMKGWSISSSSPSACSPWVRWSS
jgi:Domain of unknown function (DUF3391)